MFTHMFVLCNVTLYNTPRFNYKCTGTSNHSSVTKLSRYYKVGIKVNIKCE